MKKKTGKLRHVLLLVLMGVFVNFVFSNTLFIHVHHGTDGRSVTHSHPYLPGQSHSHSAADLDQISSINQVATGFSVAQNFKAPIVFNSVGELFPLISACKPVTFTCEQQSLRAPPALG